MAQEYNEILPSGSTNILQDNIDSRKNDEALRSGFSGSAFPTSPIPIAGQRCYREDLKKEYIFNGESWVEVASSGAIAQEVALARGTHAELQDRLSVSMNPDGTLKTPATANVDEFKVSGLEPTYVSTNSFSVPGDVRAIFTENRRLKITQGAETVYPAVVSASYDDVADKTTIVIDNITITTEMTAVDFSMVQSGLPANLNAATLNGKADTNFQEVSQKDQPGGYAGLDTEGLLPSAKLNPDVYTMGNVLGTVSQLGGVPTGAIIERGSNANGEYVRFADGTQICWKYEIVTDQSISTSYLSIYSGDRKYYYSANFIDKPTPLATIFGWGTSASWGSISTGTTGTEYAIVRGYDLVSRAAGTDCQIGYACIGRWF